MGIQEEYEKFSRETAKKFGAKPMPRKKFEKFKKAMALNFEKFLIEDRIRRARTDHLARTTFID